MLSTSKVNRAFLLMPINMLPPNQLSRLVDPGGSKACRNRKVFVKGRLRKAIRKILQLLDSVNFKSSISTYN